MKFSRRDWLKGSASFVALMAYWRPSEVAAFYHGSNVSRNPLLSQRNVVNLGFLTDFDYAFINHLIPADNAFGPGGTNFTATALTWPQSIDQNGYPNVSSASTHTWGCGVRLPASASFAGPYVITWDGDGTWSLTSGTWTEASTTTTAVGNANGTTTLSGFSSVVGIAPSFGISGTGVSGGTTVVSVNYSTNTVVVSSAVTTGTGITFTFTNSTYTKVSNGKWTNTTGIKPYILVSNSALSTPSLVSFNNSATGGSSVSVSSMAWSGGTVTVTTASPHGRPLGYSLYLTFSGATPSSLNATVLCTVTGASTYTFPLTSNPGAITGTITYIAFVTNAAMYRQADEADFMPTSIGGNGHVFRTPFKQPLVNLNPAAIRFLNWDGVNGTFASTSCTAYRFESRSLPTKGGCYTNWTAGPAYGFPTNSANVYSVAAATGTVGNTQTTPTSMVHGEVVQIVPNAAITRSGSTSISAITQANPGQVTATAHGYQNGDIVQIICGTNFAAGNPYVGMVELNYVPLTVTVVDANNFTIGIDTTTFTTFTAGTKGVAAVHAYVTLQVGSGSDRTAYPVVTPGGGNVGSAANFSTTTYASFTFDKNIAATRTAGTSLNWSMGAWVWGGNQGTGFAPFNPGTPIEYMTTLVVELNKLSNGNTIHMWLNIPHGALQPVDPNYSIASDWALQAVAVAINGANGYAGLNTTRAGLIVELSNELWNQGTFTQSAYMKFLTYIRDGTATTDSSSMTALRSTLMARNLTQNSPYIRSIKTTLGLQAVVGYTPPNTNILTGTGTSYFSDSWNTWQGSLTPISQHDACNAAPYLDPPAAYTNTSTGTGTFTDDSAMYNGTDNSSNGGGNYTGAANPTQAIANFVSQIVNQGVGASGDQTIELYCSQASPSSGILAAITTNIPAGKYLIQYEGGTDWQTAVNGSVGSHTITSGDNAFLLAVLQSQAWASAQSQFFVNFSTLSGAGPGSIYTYLSSSTTGPRWAYIWPDTYSGTTEGGAFTASPMWTALGSRNKALIP